MRETATTIKDDIRNWWADRPMTYGDLHGEALYGSETGQTESVGFGTKPFFERVDATFYKWNEELHNEDGYFGRIYPYKQCRSKNVLEIGCGMGTMAMNWAQHGCKLTAVDLNPVAVAQTSNRFKLYGLEGTIREMDANALAFPDNSFDYVYSWGVLHHSPNLELSVKELFRVLRPRSRFGVMLYNRQSIFYWHLVRYLEGFLHAESRFLNRLALASRYTDAMEQEGNPYTWPVTRAEMMKMFSVYSDDVRVTALGGVDSAFPPKIGNYLPQILKKSWSRRWGWSLWIAGTKN